MLKTIDQETKNTIREILENSNSAKRCVVKSYEVMCQTLDINRCNPTEDEASVLRQLNRIMMNTANQNLEDQMEDILQEIDPCRGIRASISDMLIEYPMELWTRFVGYHMTPNELRILDEANDATGCLDRLIERSLDELHEYLESLNKEQLIAIEDYLEVCDCDHKEPHFINHGWVVNGIKYIVEKDESEE